MAAFTCAVCEEQFPSAKLLPCRHQFCAACLHRWAAARPRGAATCPECRTAFEGSVDGLPTLRYAHLHCHFCKSSFPTFVLKFCARCGELICGNCAHAEGGAFHDPSHPLEPFAQLSFVHAVLGSLKLKAEKDSAESEPKLRRLVEAFAGELVERHSPGGRLQPLAHSVARGFGLGDLREGLGRTSQPELKARQLIQVLGETSSDEPAAQATLSEFLARFDEAWARRAARMALCDTASQACQTEGPDKVPDASDSHGSTASQSKALAKTGKRKRSETSELAGSLSRASQTQWSAAGLDILLAMSAEKEGKAEREPVRRSERLRRRAASDSDEKWAAPPPPKLSRARKSIPTQVLRKLASQGSQTADGSPLGKTPKLSSATQTSVPDRATAQKTASQACQTAAVVAPKLTSTRSGPDGATDPKTVSQSCQTATVAAPKLASTRSGPDGGTVQRAVSQACQTTALASSALETRSKVSPANVGTPQGQRATDGWLGRFVDFAKERRIGNECRYRCRRTINSLPVRIYKVLSWTELACYERAETDGELVQSYRRYRRLRQPIAWDGSLRHAALLDDYTDDGHFVRFDFR